MSDYVQGGAHFTDPANPHEAGKRTKAGLKRAIAKDPGRVLLYDTSAFDPQRSRFASELLEGTVWTVVGPDPHRDRRWYANVTRNAKGQVKVS